MHNVRERIFKVRKWVCPEGHGRVYVADKVMSYRGRLSDGKFKLECPSTIENTDRMGCELFRVPSRSGTASEEVHSLVDALSFSETIQ